MTEKGEIQVAKKNNNEVRLGNKGRYFSKKEQLSEIRQQRLMFECYENCCLQR